MGEKDKEAFENWWKKIPVQFFNGASFMEYAKNGWQAALDYKQKEIDQLQAENKKLRACTEFYGEVFNWRDSGQDYGHGTIKPDDKEDLSEDDRVRLFAGKRARQCLRELAVDQVCEKKGW